MEDKRLEAAKLGQKRYQGQPCRVCGNNERFVTNGNCVECSKEYVRKSRAKYKALIEQARAGAV